VRAPATVPAIAARCLPSVTVQMHVCVVASQLYVVHE